GDPFLQVEDIAQVAVVTLRPRLETIAGADQLHADPHRLALRANRTFQHIGNVQRLADRAQVGIAAAVVERGGASGDSQVPHARQRIQQFLGHAGGEITVIVRGAQILEWQYGDGLCRDEGNRPAIQARTLARYKGIRQQQDDRYQQHRDDPFVQLAPGGVRDGIARCDLAFALQPLWCEFVEPREREPEREADRRRDQKPSRRPVRQSDRRTELRQSLPKRPHRARVQHARAPYVAALEFGKERGPRAHGMFFGVGEPGKPMRFNAAWKCGSSRTGSNTSCQTLSCPNITSWPSRCNSSRASSRSPSNISHLTRAGAVSRSCVSLDAASTARMAAPRCAGSAMPFTSRM